MAMRLLIAQHKIVTILIKLFILIVVANIRSSHIDKKYLTLQVKQINMHSFSQQWFSTSLCSIVRIRDLDKLNLVMVVWLKSNHLALFNKYLTHNFLNNIRVKKKLTNLRINLCQTPSI